MTDDQKPAGRGLADALRQAAPYMGIGLSLAVTLLLALGAGYWLDQKLGTTPLGFLGGAVFGMLGAFYHLYKVYRGFTDRKR